jgi:hypothetical protein
MCWRKPVQCLSNLTKQASVFLHYKYYVLTYLLSYSLTQRSRVLLQKQICSQLVKKFHAFYEIRRFITALISARQLSPSWASSIQCMPIHSTFWWSILILSSHLRLGLPRGLFLSGFLTKPLYSSPHLRSTSPAHLMHLDVITRKYWVSSTDQQKQYDSYLQVTPFIHQYLINAATCWSLIYSNWWCHFRGKP